MNEYVCDFLDKYQEKINSKEKLKMLEQMRSVSNYPSTEIVHFYVHGSVTHWHLVFCFSVWRSCFKNLFSC